MKRITLFYLVIAFILSPSTCFSWGESKHPISELLIQRVYLDTNYVFCGSDASWGTNAFGLFVFDRRTETWTNYPNLLLAHAHRVRKVKVIERDGDFVYATYHGGITLRFNRYDGSYEEADKRKWRFPKKFPLRVDGVNYRIYRDSVIVGEGSEATVYIPLSALIPEPKGIKPVPKMLNPIFSYPVVLRNKIYMPYDLGLDWVTPHTEGIVTFDVVENAFHFYPSEIFKGTVTGSFVYDSLIILPTARFWYEHNSLPAAGFVAFSPADSTFSLWKELPLPDKPLAIFRVAQDEKEYWIGTDKGVFRIDKKTRKPTHYQITKGIVSKDSTNTHYAYANSQRNSSAVVAELDKGEEVELVGVLYGWCEIKTPTDIIGWVEAKYVEEVILQEDADKCTIKLLPLKIGERIPVKISDGPDAELLLTLDAYSVLEEHQYEVVGKVGKADQVTWYKIKLPTAWINMNDLIFHLDKVK